MGELANPWNNTEFTVAALPQADKDALAAGSKIVLGSYQFNNQSNDNAFQIDFELVDVVPNIVAGLPSWKLKLELQTQDANNNWHTVGELLNQLWNLEKFPLRTHIVQPNYGAEDEFTTVDFNGHRQATKTGRKLPIGQNRIALTLVDPVHGTVGQEFVSCKVSFFAETYGV